MTEFLIGVLVGTLLGATPMIVLARIARARVAGDKLVSGPKTPLSTETS